MNIESKCECVHQNNFRSRCRSFVYAPDGDLWYCTLPANHLGNHIACSPGIHNCIRWHKSTPDGAHITYDGGV